MVTVVPTRRREGIGTALLHHAAQAARDHDRTQLFTQARVGSPGAAFAVAAGAQAGMAESRYALDLTTLSWSRLDHLRPNAAGYALLSWTGPVPDEYLGQVAAVNAALSDAPHDEVEAELHWDLQQIRNANQRILTRNLRHYSVAVRHLASGNLVGLTQASVAPADAGWGTQELTVVAGPHRGHRLGMLLKVALLQVLSEREADLRMLITWTDDSNAHMNAINRTLGFQVLDQWTGFSLPLSAA
jgi:GNAT superfamily N-acetyltransferase